MWRICTVYLSREWSVSKREGRMRRRADIWREWSSGKHQAGAWSPLTRNHADAAWGGEAFQRTQARVLERAALGAYCTEGTGGQDHPKKGPQWEPVCHETIVPGSAFLPAPSPCRSWASGDGEETGEKLSHCQFMPSCSPRKLSGSQGKPGCPSPSTWKQTAHP